MLYVVGHGPRLRVWGWQQYVARSSSPLSALAKTWWFGTSSLYIVQNLVHWAALLGGSGFKSPVIMCHKLWRTMKLAQSLTRNQGTVLLDSPVFKKLIGIGSDSFNLLTNTRRASLSELLLFWYLAKSSNPPDFRAAVSPTSLTMSLAVCRADEQEASEAGKSRIRNQISSEAFQGR